MHVGVALLLGGMLVAAGLPKIIAPWYVASALRRVIDIGSDRTLRVAGRALGGWELALGAAVLLVAGPAAVPVAALTLLTFTGFAGFVVLAIRRGAACGCWASLTEGPAGGAELGRAVFLAALSADLLATRLAGTAPGGPGWQSIAPAAGLLAGTYLAARLGAALLPVPTTKLRRQLGSQVAPGAAGRAGAQLALLGGFVHAGTAAGRRRFLAATGGRITPTRDRPNVGRATGSAVRRARTALPPRPPAPRPSAGALAAHPPAPRLLAGALAAPEGSR